MLYQIEDAIKDSVNEAIGADCVGRITTNGVRLFYFYGPEFAGFDDAVARAMKSFPTYEWESDSTHDPEWELYLDLLYPTPRDWQRIKNGHVLEQLEKHGDSLKKKRIVFHWAYFADEKAKNEFVSAVKEQGFTVTGKPTVEQPDGSPLWGVTFERMDHVDWDSINAVTLELFELANSLAGDYDGWETSVEKDL